MVDKEIGSRGQFVDRRRQPRIASAPLGVDQREEGALAPLCFETACLSPVQQFPAWQEHAVPLFDSRLPDDVYPDDGFVVRQAVWNLGGLLIVKQATPAFSYERSANKVRLSPIDHWQITFLRTGCSWTESGGRVVQNTPGFMEVRSYGRPFRGRTLAADSIGLIVPADLFADRGGLPAASHNVALGGHRARLLFDHLSSVEATLSRLTQHDVPGIRDRLREMVMDAVRPLADSEDDKEQVSQVGRMARARQFIINNILSPDLTVDALCRELAISRTRLYELFETQGGVATYIRRRRLLQAHAMLTDPSETRKIAAVGLAVGFDSAANFSRAFTQQFGYSPSSVQKQGGGKGLQPRPANGQSDQRENPTFEEILRTLELS
jgi:AraC-like DNA-binding protein